ncbi:hypothetical protein BJ165DRAFT_1532536 [Panaeolus papilionaceus]|nr:hypothetical protein BJ165DRAFT_1532536 [Panaeolus papilionaceus]
MSNILDSSVQKHHYPTDRPHHNYTTITIMSNTLHNSIPTSKVSGYSSLSGAVPAGGQGGKPGNAPVGGGNPLHAPVGGSKISEYSSLSGAVTGK